MIPKIPVKVKIYMSLFDFEWREGGPGSKKEVWLGLYHCHFFFKMADFWPKSAKSLKNKNLKNLAPTFFRLYGSPYLVQAQWAHDVTTTSLRRHRFVICRRQISTNLRRRCDIADWPKMTNRFWWMYNAAATLQIGSKMTDIFWGICNVAAMSQIGPKLPINFVEYTTTLQRNYN